jgi:SH3 domain protein
MVCRAVYERPPVESSEMMQTWRALLLALALTLPAVATAAPNGYVTDQLEITLRSGPGLNFKILEMLQSGAPVEKIGEQEGWAQVRTQSGDVGWVVARYLSTEPPKGPRLEAALAELDTLRAESTQLKDQLRSAQTQGGSAAAEAKQVRQKLDAVQKEFEAWKKANADVIALRERADALDNQQQANQAELEKLRSENRSLQAREKFYWFFSGVIVLLLGWVLGYVYASSKNRAKSQARFRM